MKEKLMPDFITRHHYTTEFPKPEGHYGYAALSDAEQGFDNLRSTRDIIDSFEEYRGLEIVFYRQHSMRFPDTRRFP